MFAPRGQQLPPPPQELRPWYYRYWFLILAFMLSWPLSPYIPWLWPVWAVLIIRSPWHNGIMSGGLAWALLLIGAYWLSILLSSNPSTALFLLMPGLSLTVVTQVLWSKHKLTLPSAFPTAGEESTRDSPAVSASIERDTPRVRRTTARRRSPRRRSPRSGRRPPPRS